MTAHQWLFMRAFQLEQCSINMSSVFLKQLKTDNTTCKHIIIIISIFIHTILPSLLCHCPSVAGPGITNHNHSIYCTTLCLLFRLYKALERAVGLCWQCVKLPAAEIKQELHKNPWSIFWTTYKFDSDLYRAQQQSKNRASLHSSSNLWVWNKIKIHNRALAVFPCDCQIEKLPFFETHYVQAYSSSQEDWCQLLPNKSYTLCSFWTLCGVSSLFSSLQIICSF